MGKLLLVCLVCLVGCSSSDYYNGGVLVVTEIPLSTVELIDWDGGLLRVYSDVTSIRTSRHYNDVYVRLSGADFKTSFKIHADVEVRVTRQ